MFITDKVNRLINKLTLKEFIGNVNHQQIKLQGESIE